MARAVLGAVGQDRMAFIEQDSYYTDVDWRNENELLHHNFDHPAALAALLAWAGLADAAPLDLASLREATLERLADTVHAHLDIAALTRLTLGEPVCAN